MNQYRSVIIKHPNGKECVMKSGMCFTSQIKTSVVSTLCIALLFALTSTNLLSDGCYQLPEWYSSSGSSGCPGTACYFDFSYPATTRRGVSFRVRASCGW